MSSLPPIVGIGASAGGLEALQDFVHAIPNDSGIAFVIVQHLARDQPSLMDKLLGAHTPVPVTRIGGGEQIAPDHVYVIPPGQFLEVEDGRFRLIDNSGEEGVRTPIDRFFTSLAEQAGRRAFAVVLSGTGSDGTMGVRAVKTQGGIAIVQESGNARFPGMPDSAAATGLVDFVLRADDMPEKIIEIVRHRTALEEGFGREQLLGEIEARLDEILARLKDGVGASFSGYKPGTLVRRVARRMTLLRQSSVDGYLRTLDDKADERQLLTQDFLIGVTQFFRDPESFEAVRRQALQALLGRDQGSFRVWVPGCSTGEEAFSIAILVSELMDSSGDRRPWKLFGTDIDVDALRHARSGRFADASLKGLSEERRDRFFIRENGHWQVETRLREMCVFAPHNLLQDPPFSKLDLISCRNVMIYLNNKSQEALLPRFHYALHPGGFLWLGPSETIGRSERFFQTVDREARLFRRNDATAPGFSALSERPARLRDPDKPPGGVVPFEPRQPRRQESVEAQTEQLYLDRYAGAFATVDRNDEVVYVSEAMTALVRPARGAVGTTIDDYLAPELRLPVHSAVSETRETGLEAEVTNVVVHVNEKPRLFDVAASLFEDRGLVLIALTEVRQRTLGEAGDGLPEQAHDDSAERELMLTRKRLTALQREYESADQELRSTNEELLSMNEELQSSNEELETSREELQSINEELETINAELSENNRQLIRANSDLKNLLESTDIATLFVDDSDGVRLFTPELGRLFGVQDRDIGRSIHDLASKVDYPELKHDAERVRRSLQPVEREVRIDATDETFYARLRPYRTVDNRLDGVVITFVDITARKRYERQLEENARVLREQYAELETLYDTAPIGLALLDRDFRYLRINEELAAINGYSVEEHIGRRQQDLLPEVHAEIRDVQMRVFETGEPALGLAVRNETPAQPGRIREWLVDFYPVRDEGEVFAIGSCVREVTNERELERQVRESEARLARLFDEAPAFIAMHEGPEHVYMYSNPLHDRAVGGRDLIGRPLREAMPELEGQGIFERFDEVFRTGEPVESIEFEARIEAGDQSLRGYYRQVLQPWFDAQGRVAGVMSFAFDVTEQVEARERVQAERARLQRLQDSLSAFVGLLDAEGTLVEANETALTRGGVSRDDVIGKKFWDCWWWSFSAESQARVEDAVARAAGGEMVRYDAPARMAEGQMILIDFQLVPIFDAQGRVVEIVPSAVDITERRRAEERKDVLLAELEHRVKNILATVQSIARFTARLSRSKEEMAQSLQDRLAAISRTHDALTARDWREQNLRELAQAEIAPYADPRGRRFACSGADVLLEPAEALSLGLALHELATNAANYGAYSCEGGRVQLSVEGDGRDGFARIEWREIDGPPVKPPEHQGFGTFLIGTALARELEAEVRIEFPDDGLRCVIERKGNRHLRSSDAHP